LLDTTHPVLGLIHYVDSPVGSYNELAGFTVTGAGPKVVRMWVDSTLSRRGGRRGWGFPKLLAHLQWQDATGRIEYRARHQVWRVRAVGPCITVQLKAWSVQRLRGEDVRVPVCIVGNARLGFRGKQLALLLEDFTLDVLPPVQVSC
jgi:hypothetical protein